MYEKYSGLPDTTKSASQANGRGSEHSAARNANNEGNHGGMDVYYSPNRGGSSASGKRKNSKRAKIRKRRFVLSLMAFVFLALIIVAVVVLVRSCDEGGTVDLATGKFRSEVYINGMNLSGKTVDEIKPQLESNETYALNNIAITLNSDAVNATITGADMNASSNLNELLQTALDGGANQVYYTTISIDDEALTQRLQDINASLNSAPTEPSFTIDVPESGKPKFNYIDGAPGYGLDVASTLQLIKDAIAAGQLQTTVQPIVTTIQPTKTIDDLKALTSLIGSYSTTYDFKGTAEDTEEQRTVLIPNRAFNVEKAVSIINNNVIKPGESWSFNEVVGERTKENGWMEANGILGGDRLSKQYGGGVCQVSTTLYNALLEAYPYFADTFERQHHSWPSTYVDKGLDATVDTNHIDFAFTNQSGSPIYIFAYVSKNKMSSSRKRDLNVLIYGPALPEGAEYKTRTQIVETIPAGEDIITNSKTMFIGEEKTLAEKRDGYIVDVFIDYYLNGVLQDQHFLYEDRYEGNPLKKLVGTKATPEPSFDPSATPSP